MTTPTQEYFEKLELELQQARNEITQSENLGAWWTWTQTDFQEWCDANLMTNEQIDSTSLSNALKNNLKANNAFTRNAGKLLIIARNLIQWIVRRI